VTLFQWITLPIVAILFVRSLVVLVRGNQPRGTALLGAVIWFAAGCAILFPEITIRVASWLGIGRGADLVLYILVISYLISVFYVYNRFRKLESNVTEIVRAMAIRDASPPSTPDAIRLLDGDGRAEDETDARDV
jgi:hypothetical protein